MTSGKHYIGVDVGTSKARAAVFSDNGTLVKSSESDIIIHSYGQTYYEQSTANIWNSICTCVKDVISSIDIFSVQSIGFDATCSTVCLDTDFKPVSISIDSSALYGSETKICHKFETWDVIMWLDHRAEKEANHVNNRRHPILDYVGGSVSSEMQIPKFLWIKNHIPEAYKKIANVFQLPDYLSFKATGSTKRSHCSLVSKSNFMASGSLSSPGSWPLDFLSEIGLVDSTEDLSKLSNGPPAYPGEALGKLSIEAIRDLGLHKDVVVAAPIIDAHAGALGLLATSHCDLPVRSIENRLAIIAGTSCCHIAVSPSKVFIPGLWGPFYSSVLPDYWTIEGGQSVAGKVVDHLVESHPFFHSVLSAASAKSMGVYQFLNDHCQSNDYSSKTADFHVYPDFHGNRSPMADASLKGMVSGLSLSTDMESIGVLYLATLQSLAYSTKSITKAMYRGGLDFSVVCMTGGLSKNSLYVQLHADVLLLPVVVPRDSEAVLLGAAMLGAAACDFVSLEEAMYALSSGGDVFWPDKSRATFHNNKFEVFKEMLNDQRKYKSLMMR